MSEPFCLHVDNIPLGLVCNITWQADTLPRGQACGGERLSRQAMARYARLRGCDSLVLARERFGIVQRASMRHGSVGNGTHVPARRVKNLSLAVLATRHFGEGVAVLCLPTSEGPLYWVWAAKANVLSARSDVLVSARGKALKLAQSIGSSLGLANPKILGEDESLALLRDLAGRAAREKAGDAALLPLEPVSFGRVVLVSLMGLLSAALLIGGQTMWEWWETRARTTLLSQTREELAKKREDIRRNPEKYFDISWQKKPSAAPFVLAVVPGMLAYPLSGNGWVLQELTGTARDLFARWKALSSSLLLFPPGGAVNDVKNPGVATQTLPRSLALPKGSLTKEDLLDEGTARRILAELATRFGLRLKLSFKKPESLMVGETRVEAPWVKARVRLTAIPDYVVSDYQALAGAVDLPGLSIQSITWDGRSWSMEGELVVRR